MSLSIDFQFCIVIQDDQTKIFDRTGREVELETAARITKSLLMHYGTDDVNSIPAVVYILHSPRMQLYKIGVTSQRIEARVSAISHDVGDADLQVIQTIECSSSADAYNLESQLHDWFDYARVEGEWFTLDDSDLEDISQIDPPTLLDIVDSFQQEFRWFLRKFGKKHGGVGQSRQQFADVLRHLADQIERGDLG